jgi:hypothetical protein
MGNFSELKKISIPEIPEEVRGPRHPEFLSPSLGGRMRAPEGPLSSGDQFLWDPPPEEKMRVEPDLKNNAGVQFMELGGARESEISRQALEFEPFVLEGKSLLFGEKRAETPSSDPALREINRQLENYVSLVPQLMGDPAALEVTRILENPSALARWVRRALQVLARIFQEAFREPPFWFGGPFMIFGRIGKGFKENRG